MFEILPVLDFVKILQQNSSGKFDLRVLVPHVRRIVRQVERPLTQHFQPRKTLRLCVSA